MTWFWLGAGWVLAGGQTPALVTHVDGAVQLLQGESVSVAPLAPFLLESGHQLQLPDGVRVSVMYQGVTQVYSGPRMLGVSALEAPPTRMASSSLDDLLMRGQSDARAGATRSGPVHLSRPVAKTQVLTLSAIRWTCDDCGPQRVQVIALDTGVVLWEGTADGAATYGGPALGEGLHVVSIGGREFPFFSISPSERQQTRTQLSSVRSEGLTPLETVALEAALLLQAGYPSDALGVVDKGAREHPGEPAWAELVTQFEKRAGL